MQAHSTTVPPRLRLSPHVRACWCDDQVVLLDLRRNKYLGVAGRHLAGLVDVVDGWPVAPNAAVTPVNMANIDAAARPLLAQGVLTRRDVPTRRALVIDRASDALGAEEAIDHAVIGLRRTSLVLQSAVIAAMWLRFRSLHWIAEAVQKRRIRLESASIRQPSDAGVREAVAAHLKLRPFVYTAQERCLHDSLSLVGFLAHEGILHPRWVIGVKMHPFAAHSWVQSGTVVLNDSADRVRAYQPILVV